MTVQLFRKVLSFLLVFSCLFGVCLSSAVSEAGTASEDVAPEATPTVWPDGWQRYEFPVADGDWGFMKYSSYIFYWVYTPADLKPGLPLVVYLHSTGGIYKSALKKTEKGLPYMIVNGDVPPPECIVLVPQHPGGEYDFWDDGLNTVVALVDQVIEDYQVDQSRIALVGYSLGGIGMWDLVNAKPGVYSRLLCVEGKVNRKSQHPEMFKGCEVQVYTVLRDLAINSASAVNFVKTLNEAGIPATNTSMESTHVEAPKIVFSDEKVQEWIWLISAVVADSDPATAQTSE